MIEAGIRGPDGDGVFVFVGGRVKARWREKKARKHMCPMWRTVQLLSDAVILTVCLASGRISRVAQREREGVGLFRAPGLV